MAGEPKNQTPFTDPVDTSGIGTAAQKTLSNPPVAGIGTVRSADDLNNIATSQVDAELKGQIDPLISQDASLQTQEGQTQKSIADMFGTIMPYVAQGAQNVQNAYGAAQGMEASIASAAVQRMNQLKQSRAQEAQALAQEMGGPVSLGEFTAGVDDNALAQNNLLAGQQFHTLQYGLADVGEANAFAGRVMPLVQTEQQAQARQYFENQRKTIQDQITSLKGQRTSKINAAANDMLVKEREYALQKTQQALDKIKASHDWTATLRTLKNDDARLKIAQDQNDANLAGVTGTYKGKPTLAARALSVRDKQIAAQLGLSTKEYQLRKQSFDVNAKLATQRATVANNQTYAAWLDAGVNPQPGKTVTVTQSVPTDAAHAFKDPKNSYKGKDGKWYKIVKTQYTPQNTPITNPTALVDYLAAHNVPKAVAIRMVKRRLQIPNWVYGEGDPNAGTGTGGRSQPGGITRPG